MRRVLQLLAVATFAVAATAATAHAVEARRHVVSQREGVLRLLASLDEAPAAPRTSVNVSMNGTVARLAFKSEPLDREHAAAGAAAECGGGGDDEVIGGDRAPERFVRDSVHVDDAADGSASAILCVVRSATGEKRETLTFVRAVDAHRSSVVSVTQTSAVDLDAMFPAEGDAPGDDLPRAPRPAAARRVLSTTILESGRAVRMYETDAAPSVARGRYEDQMRAAGFVSSPAVAAKLEDTRLFVHGGDRVMASFERTETGTRIALVRVDL